MHVRISSRETTTAEGTALAIKRTAEAALPDIPGVSLQNNSMTTFSHAEFIGILIGNFISSSCAASDRCSMCRDHVRALPVSMTSDAVAQPHRLTAARTASV